VARGAPATAVHARESVMLVFRYAGQRGHEHPNPADKVPPCSIAMFQLRDRALNTTEIPWLYEPPGEGAERAHAAPGGQAAAPGHGAQVRTDGRDLGRDQLHRRHLGHSRRAHETAQSAQCLFVEAGRRYVYCAAHDGVETLGLQCRTGHRSVDTGAR
jgi:hypothetical protein